MFRAYKITPQNKEAAQCRPIIICILNNNKDSLQVYTEKSKTLHT